MGMCVKGEAIVALAHPVLEEGALLLQALEAPALEGSGLGMADGVLHRALAVGVAHARRVGDHAVMLERLSVARRQLS